MYINEQTADEKSLEDLCRELNASIPKGTENIGVWHNVEETEAPQAPEGYIAGQDGAENVNGRWRRRWKFRQLSQAEKEAQKNMAFAGLRRQRDNALAETDFMLMADYPLDAETLQKVRQYRQALRDLPGLAGAPWPDGNIPWPERNW